MVAIDAVAVTDTLAGRAENWAHVLEPLHLGALVGNRVLIVELVNRVALTDAVASRDGVLEDDAGTHKSSVGYSAWLPALSAYGG